MREKQKQPATQFFGIDLDPTDDPLALDFKFALTRSLAKAAVRYPNPYQALIGALEDLFDEGYCQGLGEIAVPSWLSSAPDPGDLPLVTPEDNKRPGGAVARDGHFPDCFGGMCLG